MSFVLFNVFASIYSAGVLIILSTKNRFIHSVQFDLVLNVNVSIQIFFLFVRLFCLYSQFNIQRFIFIIPIHLTGFTERKKKSLDSNDWFYATKWKWKFRNQNNNNNIVMSNTTTTTTTLTKHSKINFFFLQLNMQQSFSTKQKINKQKLFFFQIR